MIWRDSLTFAVNFTKISLMALSKIVIDTYVIESAVRSTKGASFQNEIIRQEIHAFFKGRAASFKESDFNEALAEIPHIASEEIDKL